MTSNRPYLIRAIYAWLVDNQQTPYLLVNAQKEKVQVPLSYINEDGTIVLNASPTATSGLKIGGYAIEFQARFLGVVHNLFIPINALLSIYSKENNRGLSFDSEDAALEKEAENTPPSTRTGKRKTTKKKELPPFLKVVK